MFCKELMNYVFWAISMRILKSSIIYCIKSTISDEDVKVTALFNTKSTLSLKLYIV